MAKATRTKRQHFVPRFYLDGFTNEAGELWTHDSQQDTLRQTQPENTGYEGNIYSPEIEAGKRVDDLESTLSRIESTAANILPELLSFRKLDEQLKADFSLFLATMFARSPAQLRQFAEVHAKTWHWTAQHQLEHEHRKKEQEGTLTEEDAKMREFLGEKHNYTINVDRRVGLASFELSDALANIMSQMTWTFEISENQELLTSDNSVFWASAGPMPVRGPYGFGLGHRQAVIPFPLNPEIILRLDWQSTPNWTKQRLLKKQARLSNQYQAKHKDRFLFFKSRDDGFRKLGMKYAAPVQQIDFGVDGPEVAVVRKLSPSRKTLAGSRD